MRFYDANDISNDDYYTVLELRRITQDYALNIFIDGIPTDSSYIVQSLRCMLDTVDKCNAITDNFWPDTNARPVSFSDEILIRKSDLRNGTTYELNKTSLLQLVNMIESLRLVDITHGFDTVITKIRNLI